MGITINNLPYATKPFPDYTIPVWTPEGTKQLPLSELLPNTPAAHNNFIRGKCLTDYYSLSEIFSMIARQDYSDIFVGDRIIAHVPAITATGFTAGSEGTAFLVAEIESHSTYGDTPLNRGHICLVPDRTLGSAKMNDTNTTEGAYEGSKMHTEIMPAVQTALEAAFGASHVLSAREFLSSVVDTTHPSAGNTAANGITQFANNWKDCKVRLMTELEVYGAHPFSSSGYDSMFGLGHQLSLFRLDHTAVFNRAYWWLSSVYHSTYFCSVGSHGLVTNAGASNSIGVRPRFIIG